MKKALEYVIVFFDTGKKEVPIGMFFCCHEIGLKKVLINHCNDPIHAAPSEGHYFDQEIDRQKKMIERYISRFYSLNELLEHYEYYSDLKENSNIKFSDIRVRFLDEAESNDVDKAASDLYDVQILEF